jgi:adenosylcobinamide-GDP ribazoletransferase
MVLAPVVGGLLAVPAGLLLLLLGWGASASSGDGLLGRGGSAGHVPALLAATLVVGLLALLTRGMHLDGLADTADGLGSGRPAAAALEVMRRGDVGPFGVVTLMLVLLVQVLALGTLAERGLGVAGLCLALVVSRLALAVACSRGVPTARPDGLGHVVAGTVGPARLAASAALALVTLAALSLLSPGLDAFGPAVLLRAAGASAVALGAAALLVRRAVRRLGGVTGDVLGAAVEVTFTAALVVLVVVT